MIALRRASSLFIAFALALTWLLIGRPAWAATFYLSPNGGTYTVGQTLTVTVRVNAGGQAINAAEATVTFPAALLDLKSVSRSGSVFTFWAIEPSGTNSTSRIIFSGGLPNPGFSGSAGTVVRANFSVKAAGKATVSISGGKILANDGQGTDVLTGQSGAVYTLQAAAAPKPSAPPATTTEPTPSPPDRPVPTVSSPTFPDEQQWYAGDKATISWSRPVGLQAVSYSLTNQADSVPDEQPESNTGSVELTLPADGVWYFHLRGQYATGWSSAVHYTLRRDSQPPEPFTVELVRDRGSADPSPVVTFAASDGGSGVAKYVLRLDEDQPAEVTSPVTLSITRSGRHTVKVTAYDRAGNSRDSQASFDVEGYPAPVINFVSSPLILLDSIVVKGTANAGDVITIFLDGQELGRVIAGRSTDRDAVNIRTPWSFTSDRLIRPGHHSIRALAVGPDGQTSVKTDPQPLLVAGRSILLGGRPIATVSIAPVLGLFLLSLLLAIVGVMTRLALAVRRMHQREAVADDDVHRLRQRLRRSRLSPGQLDASLGRIEEDLRDSHPHRRPDA